MTTRLVRNHSHWGAFLAEVEDGRVVGVRPFERDPDPSPLIEAIPAAVHSPTRIAGRWCGKDGSRTVRGRGDGRGREPFVPVSWERALDLVAGELERVRREHGHGAIMGGSQGWGSAGIFHDARTQVRRFLAAFGGFVDQTSNYSFGAALTFLPHVLGSAQAVTGPLTSWSSIARHTRLMVLFGGANPKNLQVTKGGCGEHSGGGWIAALARAGVEVINVSPIRDDGPEAARREWIADPAQHRHRHAARARAYAGRRGAARRGVSGALLRRLRAGARLSAGRDRRPAEGRRLGRGDHRRAGRHDPRARAPHGGDPHHAHRLVVAAARRSRRAAVLGGDPARRLPRPDRPAGRRLRLRLRLDRRHRRAAAGLRRRR